MARIFLIFTLLAGIISSAPADHASLPVIDLGYVKHRATEYNATGDFYIYRNIRFARPPLGDLRFRKPQPPLPQLGIQDGNIQDADCHQSYPEFYPGRELQGLTFGVEDCLFLDVYVPREVRSIDSVPVLAWWYGGGYISGSKIYSGNPAGLIQRSDKPIIYVAANYRLGAFGWLSSPDEDLDPNIGLHDARAAIDWISAHIHSFGGDPQKVTVMGESAGAGILMHQITGYGGERSPPKFQQAITQSPGFNLVKNQKANRINLYKRFEETANCTSLECLRKLPTEILLKVNLQMVVNISAISQELNISFGPVVDGDYVPDLPGVLFAKGKYHKNLKSIISANNRYEGAYFLLSPENITLGNFSDFVAIYNRNISSLPTIIELYPETKTRYGEWLRRVSFMGDYVFNCNARYLASAFKDKSWRFVFSVGAAGHGLDTFYTFYNGPGSRGVSDDKAAVLHQEFITDYVVYGKPADGKGWPEYGVDGGSNALFLNNTMIVEKDPWDGAACDWWQKGLSIDPPNVN